jgi:Protein of unknown function (DUF3617)
MSLRFVPVALATLFSFAALASGQTITPPPMKMGLWQTEVTMEMSGMPNGAGMPPRTITTQTCMTPDTWKNSLGNAQNRMRNMPASCTTSNVQEDSHHYTADVQCTAQQGFSTTAHIDMHFDSDESMHGTTNTTMSGGNTGMNMTMNSTIKSKFMSSDCGDVKPGQGKMVNSGAGPSS